MRLTVLVTCNECQGHGIYGFGHGNDPRARGYRCRVCSGFGNYEVSADVSNPTGDELIVGPIDCRLTLDRNQTWDAEQVLCDEFDKREKLEEVAHEQA